jgi:hypothetical protein
METLNAVANDFLLKVKIKGYLFFFCLDTKGTKDQA